jgi:hypothetical protein
MPETHSGPYREQLLCRHHPSSSSPPPLAFGLFQACRFIFDTGSLERREVKDASPSRQIHHLNLTKGIYRQRLSNPRTREGEKMLPLLPIGFSYCLFRSWTYGSVLHRPQRNIVLRMQKAPTGTLIPTGHFLFQVSSIFSAFLSPRCHIDPKGAEVRSGPPKNGQYRRLSSLVLSHSRAAPIPNLAVNPVISVFI